GERDPGGENGAFVAAARASRGEYAANLVFQFALEPHWAGLVEKIAHLPAHVAEARGRTDDDGVVVAQRVRVGNGSALIHFGAGIARYTFRHEFGHAPECRLR